ncbi:MAG TPA: hypothetical protein VMN03_06515, partial [Burkholderiales bacterium]|nr:hypothetical protein [Burkholderiales bacterium]
VHRVTWNFAGRQPEPIALSPSQQRDSVWMVNRINVVFDSMIKAGGNGTMLTGIKDALLAGDAPAVAERFGFGGGGGGGFGGGPMVRAGAPFVERPGETAARAARSTGGAAGAGGAGGAASADTSSDAEPPQGFAGTLGGLLRRPGQTGGGFGALNQVVQAIRGSPPPGTGGGFGAGPAVATGDYLISMTVDGKTLTRVLRVERAEATP